ncbi:FkbM family methyltransferase [Wolinella succinogenes]|uniref:FkbM family methyltransferase n=1 Tax=Wolinella succinogenes TaxID=844 RepID=UPI002FC64C07
MSNKNSFGVEFLKFFILETENNIYEPSRFPGRRKNSFLKKVIYGFLNKLEKITKKVKLFLLPINGNFVRSLKNGDFNKFEYLYSRLNDSESKEKYIKCLGFKLLGRNLVNLEMADNYYQQAKSIEKCVVNKDTSKNKFVQELLDLSSVGYKDLRLWNSYFGVYIAFVKEQYAYKDRCGVENGDVVIDAGGCYGDTALYFASKAGECGKVYVYEFVPSSIEIMQENMSLNPHLKERIQLISHPVSDSSDVEIYFTDAGPSTKIYSEKKEGSSSVKTLSIDDMVSRGNIEKIDFLKMDIEGAELSALKGAAETIKRFKPKLAICVYHKLEDFYEIPMFIDSLGVEYDMFFDYYTPVGWEMVLYCTPKSR